MHGLHPRVSDLMMDGWSQTWSGPLLVATNTPRTKPWLVQNKKSRLVRRIERPRALPALRPTSFCFLYSLTHERVGIVVFQREIRFEIESLNYIDRWWKDRHHHLYSRFPTVMALPLGKLTILVGAGLSLSLSTLYFAISITFSSTSRDLSLFITLHSSISPQNPNSVFLLYVLFLFVLFSFMGF